MASSAPTATCSRTRRGLSTPADSSGSLQWRYASWPAAHAYGCVTMQACTIFVQVDDVGGARFKVTLGPNGEMHPPYVGALVYDCYGAQSMISAPRDIGDADFEMHDLKSMSAWHRPCHTPVPTLP